MTDIGILVNVKNMPTTVDICEFNDCEIEVEIISSNSLYKFETTVLTIINLPLPAAR